AAPSTTRALCGARLWTAPPSEGFAFLGSGFGEAPGEWAARFRFAFVEDGSSRIGVKAAFLSSARPGDQASAGKRKMDCMVGSGRRRLSSEPVVSAESAWGRADGRETRGAVVMKADGRIRCWASEARCDRGWRMGMGDYKGYGAIN